MSVRLVSRDGVQIAYERRGAAAGEDTPIVLIHGLGYGRWGWEPVVDRLAAEHPVVLIDNRGIGASDVPAGPYTAAGMAEDVAAVLADAGVGSAHVIGTSLGGMIAQELAITRPECVERLVLVATTPGGADSAPMPEQTQRLLVAAQQMEPVEALRRLTVNAFSPSADPAAIERVVELRMANPQDPNGWQAQAAAGTTYDAGGRERHITAPTLVIHGTSDAVIAADNATLLAERIPEAQLSWYEGAGHLLFWETPAQFTDEVLRFLA